MVVVTPALHINRGLEWLGVMGLLKGEDVASPASPDPLLPGQVWGRTAAVP